MAELFMECEEEELEPWQKKVKEVEDDDDDEPIFVGEITSSKPAISNILNRVNPSSYSRGIKNGALTRGVAAFKPTSQHYTNPTSSPVTASPVNFHPESRSSDSSVIVQPLSKPGFVMNSSRVVSSNSSELLFDLTQDTGLCHYQGTTALSLTGVNENPFLSKRPSASEVSIVSSKKPKPSEGDVCTNALPVFSSVQSPAASPLAMSLQGANALSQSKNGTPFPRACPKCNIHFNLLDPLKNHMKYCCPDMINSFLGVTNTELGAENTNMVADSEKGKLIMLVSDFYYGKHEGDGQEEQKTHTTFKCFSCLKILKNNIRFMNHMKHHLELEKQSSESWENHTTCQHCYRQFPTPFQLQCHIESTHTPHEFSTICKICELSFETEHILLQHMKDNHKPGEMPYICQVCNFRSSSFSDVESHFRTSHENTKNLLCPFCLKVIKIATPYMHHYMKHQKKGIHRCTKCRLQFLTCKEKMDHKAQHHRTFIKPKQLEGLPPGTKVTIRASVGPVQSGSSVTPSISASTSTLQLSPPRTKFVATKNPTKINITKPTITKPTGSNSNESKPKCKPKASSIQKKQSTLTNSSKKSKVNTVLKNLRSRPGAHKCIECCSEVKDFSNHFPTYVHCSFCRYNTSCSKAYVNHMMSFHSNRPSKRFCIFKKHSENLRGITLVCLNCDFLSDVSGLDNMATHLSQHETHTCQVVLDKVSVCIPTSEHLSEFKYEASNKEQEPVSEEITRPNTPEGEAEASNSESKHDRASLEEEKTECSLSSVEDSTATKSEESIAVSEKKSDACLEAQEASSKDTVSSDLGTSADEVQKEEQVEHSCQERESETSHSPEYTISQDQIEHPNSSEEATLPSENMKGLQLVCGSVGGNTGFNLFLKKRNEYRAGISAASDQDSVHLEPLTPSEVLEYEATEILQKESGDSPVKRSEDMPNLTEDMPAGTSPSTTKAERDAAEQRERS